MGGSGKGELFPCCLHLFIHGKAGFHAQHLFRRGGRLIFRLPFVHRHAVDHGAGLTLVAFKAGIANPVRQAIAAKAGQAHQVDILRVMATLQVLHQPTEGRCGDLIRQLVNGGIRLAHESILKNCRLRAQARPCNVQRL